MVSKDRCMHIDINIENEINQDYNEKIVGTTYQKILHDEFESAISDKNIKEPEESVIKRLDDVFYAELNKQTKKHNIKKRYHKIINVAAAVAIFIFALIPIITITVSANKEIVANFFIQNFDEYSVIKYDSNEHAIKPYGWNSSYYATWIPTGFNYNKIQYTDNLDTVWFKSDGGLSFNFSVSVASNNVEIDTENYSSEKTTIKNTPAVLYTSIDFSERLLVITKNDVVLKIAGTLSEYDIIKIAENINNI